MSAVYTMSCWNSTNNPDGVNKAKILAQTFKLVKALQGTLSDGQIALPSRDKDESKQGAEVMIWHKFNPGSSFFDNVKKVLNEKAKDLKLDYKDFVLESESLTRNFPQQEQANIRAFNKSVSVSPTETDIRKWIALSQKEAPRTDDAKDIPGKQLSVPFQMSTNRVERLRKASGDGLKDEILGIMDDVNSIVSSTKTGWTTIMMIAAGVVTLGTWITYTLTGVELALTSIAVVSLLSAVSHRSPRSLPP